MAGLGKWVTAAGGAMIALFSLIGLIIAISALEDGGVITVAIFQGLVFIIIGAKIALASLIMYDRAAKVICWMGVAMVFLASRLAPGMVPMVRGMGVGEISPIAVGDMNFFITLGALIAIVGANWSTCLGGANSLDELFGRSGNSTPATPSGEESAPSAGGTAPPPESKL
jgi:hypothetical protein